MKRTTIFLPDTVHEALRREAFQARMSMAALIRKRLEPPVRGNPKRVSGDPLLKVAGICRGQPLSADIDEHLYG